MENQRTTFSQIHSLFHSAREYLNPILTESKFRETGVLTPQEFVLCGDFLVFKCPTWQWAAGEKSLKRDYLPDDKQYLITRNIPCLRRVVDEVKQNQIAANDEVNDGDWIVSHNTSKNQPNAGLLSPMAADVNEIKDIDDLDADDGKVGDELAKKANALSLSSPKTEDVPDLDDLDGFEGVEVPDDEAALDQDDNILKTRTYDMSITYDKYYQTPRVWLYGFDEHRRPLTSKQVFQDISQDHAQKTVTIEQHPHEKITLASIHPCKHANVMKRLIDMMNEVDQNGGKKEIRVDQYLLLFLKFMASVLPTMDYDFSSEI